MTPRFPNQPACGTPAAGACHQRELHRTEVGLVQTTGFRVRQRPELGPTLDVGLARDLHQALTFLSLLLLLGRQPLVQDILGRGHQGQAVEGDVAPCLSHSS